MLSILKSPPAHVRHRDTHSTLNQIHGGEYLEKKVRRK